MITLSVEDVSVIRGIGDGDLGQALPDYLPGDGSFLKMVVAVAVANKLARAIWALLTTGKVYRTA